MSRVTACPLSWAWRTIRPTLFPVLRTNRLITRNVTTDAYQEETDWRSTLHDIAPEERSLAVSNLWFVFESDQNRIRGIEAKALSVLQIASLVFVGDVAAITLAVREEALYPAWSIGIVIASCVYLTAALWASVSVAKPEPRYMLRPDDVLPPEHAGARLASSTKLNESKGIVRSNLTSAAIFDVVRALVASAAAVIAAIPAY